MTPPTWHRGDVLLVDFSPGREHAADLVRPAVVVTNDNANLYSPSIVVVPLTSNVANVLAFQVLLPSSRTGLDKDSKAQIELIRGIARSRVRRVIGSVPADLMSVIDRRLAEHLELAPHGSG